MFILIDPCPAHFREKDALIDTLANIKRQMLDMQERELQAVEKVKIGIEITEQANIDKTQVRDS